MFGSRINPKLTKHASTLGNECPAFCVQELEEERKAARSRLGLAEAPSRWGSIPEREKLPEGLSVSRTYWALVAGRLKPGDKGRITLPVPAPGGGRRARAGSGETSAGVGPRPALTLYRVRACRDGVSWVELTPITGEHVSVPTMHTLIFSRCS